MPCHWYRNRHVDAHHADLHTARELPGNVAVPRKARYAVAVLMRVGQLAGLCKVFHARTTKLRAEDFFLVDLHVRGHVVKVRAGVPETVVATGASLRCLELAPVDD